MIEIAGEDRVGFLQGLVSNDVALAAPGRAVWAALLTPQGKWLADFFVFSDGVRLLLDAERGAVAGLVLRLSRFRLRAKVTVADCSDALGVYAAWGDAPAAWPAGALVAADPRLPAAGWRMLGAPGLAVTTDEGAWDAHRIGLGLPDGSADMEAEKSVLLEAGFDELHGVSWTKGCYLGQELTARTKYRGLVKRRLLPVAVAGPLPPPGTAVFRGDAEIGVMRSGRDGRGLALLRIEALAGGELRCGEAALSPLIPDWMVLPAVAGA